MSKIKILDCTLRDGGYYTNWDFEKSVVEKYIKATNVLPVDYIEIGYRNKPQSSYMGKYGYCPIFELQYIRQNSLKKISVMLNEKDVRCSDIDLLLSPITKLVDMIRIAVSPENFDRAVTLAKTIKKMGFEVGFNVMYMSKWRDYNGFYDKIKSVNEIVDIFCMVDSYGSVSPNDVAEVTQLVKKNLTCTIGFHGHNNLEMGLANTLTAIENGVDCVDATILGMGRGAGNLKTELLLTYLNKHYDYKVDFNVLGDLIIVFSDLLEKHKWGTNLPYMISGANSLPQKDVMEWVTTRFYSFNSIIRALENQKNNVEDNDKYPVVEIKKHNEVIVIGGGPSAVEHADGIKEFIKSKKDICIIHASSKNAKCYKDLNVSQIFCLVGNEGHRMEKVFEDLGDFEGVCILPPYPRKMGTYVPAIIKEKTFELENVNLTDKYKDSHTALALQTALILEAQKMYIVGYDGYMNEVVTQKERELTTENNYLFNLISSKLELLSLTPTNYKDIKTQSIYAFLTDGE